MTGAMHWYGYLLVSAIPAVAIGSVALYAYWLKRRR